MDVEAKRSLLKEAIKEQQIKLVLKEISEKFWLQRVSKNTKDEDLYKMTAAAANNEKHEAEAMLEFLIKELADLDVPKA